MGKEQELILAAQSGNLVLIDKILGQRSKKASVFGRNVGPNCQDTNGYTPLHHAALNGRRDAVEALLKYGASTNIPDSAGSYPLHLAAWNGHADILELLLNKGPSRANVNEQNNLNETALHLSCQYGHNRVVVVLLECHADPNYRNLNHESALDLAAQYGRLESVNTLLMYYPALVMKTVSQHTPVHLASRNGHYAVVKSLLDKGMSPNIESDDGTPLHVAALYGKSDIVKLLLQSGVDINVRNKNGATVMDLLTENPTQRSRDITAWIYTYLQNKQQSSAIGGKNRSVSDAVPSNNVEYDAIPPPRPISEFASLSNIRPSAYDEVPSPHALRGAINEASSFEMANENYDTVPNRSLRGDPRRGNNLQVNRQMSYDEVPLPRPFNENNHAQSMPNSIQMDPSSSYDVVPAPRQASEPFMNVLGVYGVVGRPKSLDIHPPQYQVPVTCSSPVAPAIPSVYGTVAPIRPGGGYSATLPPTSGPYSGGGISSEYSLLNVPTTARPVVPSIYGTVQTPQDPRAMRCPLDATSTAQVVNSSQRGDRGPNAETSPERPNVLPLGQQDAPRRSPVPDSSYEFVELPVGRPDFQSSTASDRSAPISIPSQAEQRLARQQSLSYDTVTSPPLRRAEPIGAPESPYKNIDPILAFNNETATQAPRTPREDRVGDGLRQSDTRRDPEGAKDQNPQRGVRTLPRTGRAPEYENVTLPMRSASLRQDDVIYQNSPVSSPSYEYNVPNPQVKSGSQHQGSDESGALNSSPTPDRQSTAPLSGSPSSSERRTTDYENIDLPGQTSSTGSNSSPQKARNAYEILPPHLLHGPPEPSSPKPDASGKIRPPIPKPYRESKASHLVMSDENDEYCTLKEAGITTTPSSEPYPPFSPPSPSTAGQYLFNAFDIQAQQRDSGGSDESSRRSSDCADGSHSRSRTLKYENVMFDKPSPTASGEDTSPNTNHGIIGDGYRLSSVNDGDLNEFEEWKKIERFMSLLGEEIGEEQREAEDHMTSAIGKWLNSFGLGLYESYFLANGFDDIEFMAGGILEEQDLLEMGVLDPAYRKTVLDEVAELARPPRVGVHGFDPKTVEEWLNALHLEEYLDLFHRKGYSTMERIKQMWELELQSVLAIHILGHRKRILASLPEVIKRRDSDVVSANYLRERLAEIDVFGGERKEMLDVYNPGVVNWRTTSDVRRQQDVAEERKAMEQRAVQLQRQQQQQQQLLQQQQLQQQQLQQQQLQQQQLQRQQLQQQQRQQQQQQEANPTAPPQTKHAKEKKKQGIAEQKNEARWGHPPEALLKGNVNYTTRYLGSHFIKDVIGESSTVEACRKMRMSTQKLQKIPAVILSISVTGVRFIDARSRIVISSHYVHNISYCTQDLEDRSVLAYIAKDQKANAHYCHVFKANSPAISDEIVLTIGQAFELAYEQYTRSQYTSGPD